MLRLDMKSFNKPCPRVLTAGVLGGLAWAAIVAVLAGTGA